MGSSTDAHAYDDEAGSFLGAIARYRGPSSGACILISTSTWVTPFTRIPGTCSGLVLGSDDGGKDHGVEARPLSSEEVAGLEARGNVALGEDGWAGVSVQVCTAAAGTY